MRFRPGSAGWSMPNQWKTGGASSETADEETVPRWRAAVGPNRLASALAPFTSTGGPLSLVALLAC
jgi:hypothetical protein